MRQTSSMRLLVALVWPALGVAPVAGQATVTGVVVEAATGRPLADVLVLIDTLRLVTTADGRFRFTPVSAGNRTLRFSHVAYAERQDTLAVRDGDHFELHIPLVVQAIELPPLTVEVRSRYLMDIGFYDRAARGMGIHIDRAELEKTQSTQLGDFIARVPGVRRAFVNGEMTRIDMRGGKSISMPCDTQYFLDGTAMAAGAAILDNLSPHRVEGIEIYRGASETPSQFDLGRTSCGAIVIWTRRN